MPPENLGEHTLRENNSQAALLHIRLRYFFPENRTHISSWRPSHDTVKSLHNIIVQGFGNITIKGDYRRDHRTILHSPHTIPIPHKIPRFQIVPYLMDEFLVYLGSRWEDINPYQLGALCMWRLSHIHPFEDGNDRTSRLFCYLCMTMKIGTWIRGSDTILYQLEQEPFRSQYYGALQQGDNGNLNPLADLLLNLSLIHI